MGVFGARESALAAWPVSYKLYFSRLTSPTGKWVNTEIPITYTDPDGSVYYGFATQNPIRLQRWACSLQLIIGTVKML